MPLKRWLNRHYSSKVNIRCNRRCNNPHETQAAVFEMPVAMIDLLVLQFSFYTRVYSCCTPHVMNLVHPGLQRLYTRVYTQFVHRQFKWGVLLSFKDSFFQQKFPVHHNKSGLFGRLAYFILFLFRKFFFSDFNYLIFVVNDTNIDSYETEMD